MCVLGKQTIGKYTNGKGPGWAGAEDRTGGSIVTQPLGSVTQCLVPTEGGRLAHPGHPEITGATAPAWC